MGDEQGKPDVEVTPEMEAELAAMGRGERPKGGE